jgi:serine/threonine-protein phosphatase PGAM5
MKTVILIRHAQYSRNPEKLTSLGKKQAALTARYLRELKVDRLLSSTMPRAIETAQIIAKKLKLFPSPKSIFREASLPIRGQDFEKVHGTKLSSEECRELKSKMTKYQARADLAFRSLFQSKPTPETVVLVSHGNVIRYWICRALDIDIRKWVLMDIHQCSITQISIDADGTMKVLGFSDIGHIPIKSRTYI